MREINQKNQDDAYLKIAPFQATETNEELIFFRKKVINNWYHS
jgi:hypothetical protein